MSVFDPEQLIAVQKANSATLFALTNQAFERFQRLVQLNLQTVQSALAKSEAYWLEAQSVKTPEEFLAWRTNLMQPAAEQALSYGRQLCDIASGIQAEWMNAATAQYEHHSRTTQTLVDNLAKNAPAGTEIATAMTKSVFSTASSAGEMVRKAAAQAIEAAKGTRTANR
ncbi:TIGR01841 family phasin [Paraburkholderia madseniana]|uniref:TIGR01841 family phasin n=1 Tax=Paraburkholderia madseniana TaxID=2599607 RepID=A0A6N6WPC7_9BURK|nr:TIGR01841 family phasin [Paraburkholderia madseniana]KAE8761130.1 TIGR01841 family phasin [Paraburkholderia madseniana]